ncbi:MAG: diguanylate cyclase [Halanaerobiales bacterium]
MSMISLMVMTIILLFFTTIVYYFNKKDYREHGEASNLFLIGMSTLFFISLALSFLDIETQYLVYIYLFSTTGALLVNHSLNNFFYNKSRKVWTVFYLLYLFCILVFLQYDNYLFSIILTSKILIIMYFLDVSFFITKSERVDSLHKIFFSTTFVLWSFYEFLSVFFNTKQLYLMGIIFPIAVAYEFMNLKLELINVEIKTYGQRFKSIFENVSDAFFVVDSQNYEILNLNKAALDIFQLDHQEFDELKLKDIFNESSLNLLKELFNKDEKENDFPIELRTIDKKENDIFLETDFSFMSLNGKEVVVIAMKDKTEEIILKNELMKNKNKIEKLHDVAIQMENSSKKGEIYRLTVEAGEDILDYDVISLDVVKNNKLMSVGKSESVTDDDVKSIRLDEVSLATKAFHEQRTIICNNIPAERDASPVRTKYKSALTVPIQKFGTFQIISEEYNYFNKEDQNLVELLISHTGAALKRLNREEDIRYFGFHDSLTGLYNRDYIEEEIKRFNNSRRLPISIIIADVNGLKLINDTFGHEDGDQLLKRISLTLDETCRDEDILGRWGGDEFLVVLPNTGKKDVEKIVNRINQSLKEQYYKDIPLSVSFGCATKFRTEEDMEDIINKADGKMYNNKTQNYEKNSDRMLEMLYKKLNELGYETEAHCERVKQLTEEFAGKLDLKREKIEIIKKIARIHDIGMINIPKEIVKKDGELTEEEFKIIQSHPEVGFRIASSLNEINEISQAILHHHEWWNGTGYPERKAKENIPLLARIVSIVDAFDIMTHDQVYKNKITREEAVQRIKSMSGIQFDPVLSKIFIKEVLNNN